MENGFVKALQHVQGYVSNLGDPTLQFFIKKGFGASFPQELFFHQSKIIPFKFGYVLTGDQNLVNLGKHSHG